MRKYKMIYLSVIIISLLLIFTKSVSGSIIIYSYNDADRGIIDGFKGDINVSIVNCIFIALSLILTTIITFNKNNKINIKWLLFLLIIFLIFCIPIGINYYSGGFAGIKGEKYMYLWNIATFLFYLI